MGTQGVGGTLAEIEANIVDRFFLTADQIIPYYKKLPEPSKTSIGKLSICILVTQNGSVVIGKTFDHKQLAYQDAIRQLQG